MLNNMAQPLVFLVAGVQPNLMKHAPILHTANKGSGQLPSFRFRSSKDIEQSILSLPRLLGIKAFIQQLQVKVCVLASL